MIVHLKVGFLIHFYVCINQSVWWGPSNMLLVKLSKFLNQESYLRMIQVMTSLNFEKSSYFANIEVLEVWFESHTCLTRLKVRECLGMTFMLSWLNHNIYNSNHNRLIWITNCMTWIKHKLQPLEIGYVNLIQIRAFMSQIMWLESQKAWLKSNG